MKITPTNTARALALLLAGLLAATGAMAEQPDWAGGGNKGALKKKQLTEIHGASLAGEHDKRARHFGDEQRTAVQNYYRQAYRVGRCPPGLAKKNNGCLPPGQARKWAVGQPLPRDVVYYSVPKALSVQLGVAPSGHRYVRVAADILLIAIGTGLVVDAIQDLGRL